MMRYDFEMYRKYNKKFAVGKTPGYSYRYRIIDRQRGLDFPIGNIFTAHDAQMIVDALNRQMVMTDFARRVDAILR